MPWEEAVLVGRIEGKNDDEKNEGGLVILVKPGPSGREEEVARVAFDRTEGSDKDAAFNDKVDEAVAIAQKSIDTIKDLFQKAGQLQ